MARSCSAACQEKCARCEAERPLSATQWSSHTRPPSCLPVSYITCVCACTAWPEEGSQNSALSASSPASSKRPWSCRVKASSEMYHQWSPYAGASPSTRSQASCWMSVTPENAIVGTAAETARTSRGWWAMWFISAVAPSWRASSTRRPMTSTRLRSRSSPRFRTARRAACSEPATSVDGPGLVAEHRQRGVGQREVGVERRRLAQQLLAAGLEAHHPLQTGVVARRRLGGRRQRQAEGVAGTGDGVVAADQPAVLEAARHRGDGVEHVDRQAERLAADLGDRGRLPELAAPQRTQRPHRCVRPTGRVQQPSVAGPEAHPGGGRLRQGDAAAHGEEVVEHAGCRGVVRRGRGRCS